MDRRGRFWKDDEPFEHARIVAFLRRHIEARDTGYVVQMGTHWVPLELEDLPIRVLSLDAGGEAGAMTLHLDDGRRDQASWAHSLRCDAQERVCCSVPSASGQSLLQARLGNAALMQLSEYLDQLDHEAPVWTAGPEEPILLPNFYS